MQTRDRRRLAEALDWALERHAGASRKGTGSPYASHVIQVAGLVMEHGGDADQIVAALLHDVVEDTDSTIEDVDSRFGPSVSRIVADCTDTLPGDTPDRKSSWQQRKERHLDHLLAIDDRSALVAACDKRHNLEAIVADLRREGPATLERFNARTPAAVLWYYGEAVDRLRATLPPRLEADLDQLLGELRRLLGVTTA